MYEATIEGRRRSRALENSCAASRTGSHFGEWSEIYGDNFSRSAFRVQKTHEVNERALKHLRKMFESKLAELTADHIEMYLASGSSDGRW